MSRFITLLSVGLSALTATVSGCADHNVNARFGTLNKRADGGQDWAYEASYNWGMINPNYTLCQTGTQQSPIQLLLTQGLSQNHIPTFSYGTPLQGDLYNWGYGPAFTLNGSDITTHPTITFDGETAYLIGWHIHAPADHSVQGDRSKAELHLVHADAEGNPRGVLAIRIDAGNGASPFFNQFISAAGGNTTTPVNATAPAKRATTPGTTSSFPGFGSTERIPLTMNAELAIGEVNRFNDFWTYQGSLTSPPCTEGIRFWVARNVMFVSNAQMQEILAVSTYSARAEQEVWMHQINV